MQGRTLVYFLQDLSTYKIGITNNLHRRLKTLETGNPYLRLIAHTKWMSRQDAIWLENSLHVKYARRRVRGEWFDLEPKEVTEIMDLLKARKPAISKYTGSGGFLHRLWRFIMWGER